MGVGPAMSKVEASGPERPTAGPRGRAALSSDPPSTPPEGSNDFSTGPVASPGEQGLRRSCRGGASLLGTHGRLVKGRLA
eukprot:3217301-Alexandrium_andersonii.AAC.1